MTKMENNDCETGVGQQVAINILINNGIDEIEIEKSVKEVLTGILDKCSESLNYSCTPRHEVAKMTSQEEKTEIEILQKQDGNGMLESVGWTSFSKHNLSTIGKCQSISNISHIPEHRMLIDLTKSDIYSNESHNSQSGPKITLQGTPSPLALKNCNESSYTPGKEDHFCDNKYVLDQEDVQFSDVAEKDETVTDEQEIKMKIFQNHDSMEDSVINENQEDTDETTIHMDPEGATTEEQTLESDESEEKILNDWPVGEEPGVQSIPGNVGTIVKNETSEGHTALQSMPDGPLVVECSKDQEKTDVQGMGYDGDQIVQDVPADQYVTVQDKTVQKEDTVGNDATVEKETNLQDAAVEETPDTDMKEQTIIEYTTFGKQTIIEYTTFGEQTIEQDTTVEETNFTQDTIIEQETILHNTTFDVQDMKVEEDSICVVQDATGEDESTGVVQGANVQEPTHNQNILFEGQYVEDAAIEEQIVSHDTVVEEHTKVQNMTAQEESTCVVQDITLEGEPTCIVQDATVGEESTFVVQDVTVEGEPTCVIVQEALTFEEEPTNLDRVDEQNMQDRTYVQNYNGTGTSTQDTTSGEGIIQQYAPFKEPTIVQDGAVELQAIVQDMLVGDSEETFVEHKAVGDVDVLERTVEKQSVVENLTTEESIVQQDCSLGEQLDNIKEKGFGCQKMEQTVPQNHECKERTIQADHNVDRFIKMDEADTENDISINQMHLLEEKEMRVELSSNILVNKDEQVCHGSVAHPPEKVAEERNTCASMDIDEVGSSCRKSVVSDSSCNSCGIWTDKKGSESDIFRGNDVKLPTSLLELKRSHDITEETKISGDEPCLKRKCASLNSSQSDHAVPSEEACSVDQNEEAGIYGPDSKFDSPDQKKRDERGGEFKWKYVPSFETDDAVVPQRSDQDGCDKLIRVAPLPLCRKPRRLGLSKKQKIQHLHSKFYPDH